MFKYIILTILMATTCFAQSWNGNSDPTPVIITGGTLACGGSIASLNGQSNVNQFLQTGAAGSDFVISSSGGIHTFNIPTATASARGLLGSSDWTSFHNTAVANTGDVVTGTANGLSLAGQTLSLQAASASAPGALASADFQFFNKASTGVNSQNTVIHVDGARTDGYTQDGSLANPYKTIQGCIDRIAANGDNSPSKLYGCVIHGPYIYRENVTLESLNLQRLYIVGLGATQGIVIFPASGDALRSISNNNNLKELFMDNLRIIGQTELIGDTSGSTFLDVNGSFNNITFDEGSSPIIVKNVVDFELHGGNQTSDISLENVSFAELDHGNGFTGNLSVVTNLSHNQPDGFGGTTAILEGMTATGTMTNDAGSLLQFRNGVRAGSSGGSLTNAGTLQVYDAVIRSNITNSGTLNLRGGKYLGSLTNTGTVTRDVDLGQFKSFTSSPVTCTGSSQNIAHGLGYLPAHVLISAQDSSGANPFTITEGSHTSTNVVVTCTSGLVIKAMAF